jgi:hypothetical protein
VRHPSDVVVPDAAPTAPNRAHGAWGRAADDRNPRRLHWISEISLCGYQSTRMIFAISTVMRFWKYVLSDRPRICLATARADVWSEWKEQRDAHNRRKCRWWVIRLHSVSFGSAVLASILVGHVFAICPSPPQVLQRFALLSGATPEKSSASWRSISSRLAMSSLAWLICSSIIIDYSAACASVWR